MFARLFRNSGEARLWSAEIRAMAALAWPMVLTNVAQTAMTVTDVMMMGWLGPTELAAGTLGANLYFSPFIFGMGLVLAVSPMIAFELGRKRHSVRDVRRSVRQGFWIAGSVSVPIWVLLWFAEDILVAMGQDPALSAVAGSYVRALQWGALPFYCFAVLRSFISALERPRWAMWIVVGAVVFNAVFNYGIMFGNFGFPRLGVVGAGVTTTVASTLMFLALAVVVSTDRKFRRYRLFGRFWRADWPRYREMLRLGLPIAGIMAFEVTLFNGAALLMGLIDAVSLAAHAIAIQFGSLAFMVPMGIGQAVTVRVGRAYGAGDRGGITRAGWTAFGLGIGFMMCSATVMITLPDVLISAFIDASDPKAAPIAALAVTFLSLAALFQIVDGAQAVGAGMLRGLQDTTVPMIYAAIGYWLVGMPLGVTLAFGLGIGGAGIWMGLVAGLAVVAVLLISRWLRREKLIAARMPSPRSSVS